MDRPERNRDRPERRRRAAIARTGSLAAAVAMVLFVAATYPLTRGGGAGWVAAGTGPVRGGPPGCAVTYQVDPGRSGLPTGDLTLTFTASDPASAWTLTFALPAGQRLVDLAGGDWSQTGHLVTVRRGAGGQGGATHLPFRLSFAGPYRDGDSPPSSFALDGVACSTDLGGSADGGAGDPARTGIAAGCWPCPPDGTGDGRNPTTVRLPGQHRTGTGAAGGSTAAGAGSVTSVTGPLPGASPAGPVPGAPPTGPGAPPTDPVPGVPPTTPPPAPTPPSTPTPTPPVTPVPTEPPHPTVPPTDPPTQAPTPTPYPTPYPQPSTVPPSPSQPPAPHPASSPPSPPHASVPAQTATPV